MSTCSRLTGAGLVGPMLRPIRCWQALSAGASRSIGPIRSLMRTAALRMQLFPARIPPKGVQLQRSGRMNSPRGGWALQEGPDGAEGRHGQQPVPYPEWPLPTKLAEHFGARRPHSRELLRARRPWGGLALFRVSAPCQGPGRLFG